MAYLNTGTPGDILTDDSGNILLTDFITAIDVSLLPSLLVADDVFYSPIVGGGFIAAQRFRYSVFNQ